MPLTLASGRTESDVFNDVSFVVNGLVKNFALSQ